MDDETDADIWLFTYERDGRVEHLLQHPELVIRAFNQDHFDTETDYHCVPKELFKRLDVIQAYAENGGMMYPSMPKDHNENRQLCLSFIKGVTDEGSEEALDWISQHFFTDKSFVLEAIRVAGCGFDSLELVAKCPRDIIDYNVRFALLDAHDGDFNLFVEHIGETEIRDLLPVFVRDIKERLECFDSFVAFLVGVSIADQHLIPPSLRSPLPMLNKGPETVKGIGKNIRAYLGAPVGNELWVLRRALLDCKEYDDGEAA